MVAAAVVGVYLLVSRPKQFANGGPACGNCGYNLTGSTANSCPECGLKFIEAGIRTTAQGWVRGRKLVGVVLLLVPMLLFGGMALTLMARGQATRARAQAIAAQQKAIQAAVEAAEAEAQSDGTTRTTDSP
jgi:predicted RNA-binding Zn-ribbon protein involved in translation (DUF1610 family)